MDFHFISPIHARALLRTNFLNEFPCKWIKKNESPNEIMSE